MKVREHTRKWWILFAMTSCISIIYLDISILPVALPTIQRELGLSEVGLHWIINAYILAMCIFLLAGGRFGDKFGNRTVFCYGLFIFCLGSALCGMSDSGWWFISSRFLQGAGGAMLGPNAASILFDSFSENKGKAIGLYLSVGSFFLAIGPFIGGVFTQYLSWRFAFWVNIPIGLFGLILTLLVVPKPHLHHQKFDTKGFLAFGLGISAIVIALMQAKSWGWGSWPILSLFALGFSLLFLLWKIDRYAEDSYIDFQLLKNSAFFGSFCSIFCTQFILIVIIFWAVYFQNALAYTPSEAGTLSFLSTAPVIITAPLGGHLFDKHGPRIPIVIGFVLILVGLFWFLQNLNEKNILILLSALIPFGCGIPLVTTPSYTAALAELPSRKRGLASGSLSMVRQLGATLGLSIMSILLTHIQMSHLARDLQHNTQTTQIDPANLQGLLAHTPKALETLQALPKATQQFVEQNYLYAYLAGFKAILLLAIGMAAVGLILACYFFRKNKQPEIEL